MATRTATAQWNGTLKEGNGTMAGGSGGFEMPFTYKSRFEGEGANPEELIGAALAGCFSMQVSTDLAEAGTPVESVRTEARVQLRMGDEGPYIASIALTARGRVPGLDDAAFKAAAETAKSGCIVSRALAAVGDITVDAALEG
ncbi:MAG: OsmC family peroxiredoxin [Solirubrobacteraceae bacterium]